jgi:hypothetical protein
MLTTARHGRLMAARLDDLYAVTLRCPRNSQPPTVGT